VGGGGQQAIGPEDQGGKGLFLIFGGLRGMSQNKDGNSKHVKQRPQRLKALSASETLSAI